MLAGGCPVVDGLPVEHRAIGEDQPHVTFLTLDSGDGLLPDGDAGGGQPAHGRFRDGMPVRADDDVFTEPVGDVQRLHDLRQFVPEHREGHALGLVAVAEGAVEDTASEAGGKPVDGVSEVNLSRCQDQLAGPVRVAAGQRHGKPVFGTHDAVDLAHPQLHARVRRQFLATHLAQLGRGEAVPAEEHVHLGRRRVARAATVHHQHPSPLSARHQGGVEAGRPPAHHDHVVHGILLAGDAGTRAINENDNSYHLARLPVPRERPSR